MRANIAGAVIALIAIAATLALTAGCLGGATPIGKLLDDPARYDGKVVRVAGDVGLSAGILGYGAYQVDDGTGTINVVSQAGGAPRGGSRVGVEGTFRAVYTLGTQSMAVIVEGRRTTR